MTNDILIEMGIRICNRRKELGLTQEYLAECVGVSTNMISNLERGKKAIRPENLIRVADTLQTSTDFLLKGNCETTDFGLLYKKISQLNIKDFHLIENIVEYLSNYNK